MISTRYKFIYLHIPKTAGNSLQEALLPLSDDQKVLGEKRDGVDRYEIKGDITPKKHATLSDYRERIGDTSGYTVIASVRHPVERAVSFYFSPHRWMRQAPDGSWVQGEWTWDIDEFRALLPRVKSMTSFLMEEGQFRKPDNLIRYESLESDYRSLVQSLGLPAPLDLPVRNRSFVPLEAAQRAAADPAVIEAVRDHYADDFTLLGY